MDELSRGLMFVGLYILAFVPGVLLLRNRVRMPNEAYRKLLHCILLGALLVWTLGFTTWYLSVLSAVGFAAVVYPILIVAERNMIFRSLMPERKHGEFRSSLLIVFLMYAIIMIVCWGWLGDRMLGLCSIYAWGFGDAAAALIGKRYGKHGIQGRHIEGRKSVEGTAAMLVVSFVSVLILLYCRGGMTGYVCAMIAAITALVSAAVELFSVKGMDTIMCPLAAMAVLLPMVHFFGGGI